MTRRLLPSLLVAVLALGVAACGDSDEQPATNEPNPSESSSDDATQPAPSSLAPSDDADTDDPEDESESADPEESEQPGDDDADPGEAAVLASMQTSLDALVDPKTSPQAKAARVVGGADLAPLFRQFQRSGQGDGIVFTVEDPDVEGDRATAEVGATQGGQPLAQPEDTPFVLAEGEWRLERATVCDFATTVGLTCP